MALSNETTVSVVYRCAAYVWLWLGLMCNKRLGLVLSAKSLFIRLLLYIYHTTSNDVRAS